MEKKIASLFMWVVFQPLRAYLRWACWVEQGQVKADFSGCKYSRDEGEKS